MKGCAPVGWAYESLVRDASPPPEQALSKVPLASRLYLSNGFPFLFLVSHLGLGVTPPTPILWPLH